MNATAFVALSQNAALLLALVVVYDLTVSPGSTRSSRWRQILFGLAIGAMGVGIIATRFEHSPGIVFDTRSVLISLSGLFFGTVPTVVAALMTAAYRLWLGGGGAWPGVGVIATSAALGLLWRFRRRRDLAELDWRDFLGLGLVVHAVMLAMMLTLGWERARTVIATIGPPVMLIYPSATIALGVLLAGRLRREEARAELRRAGRLSRIGSWRVDLKKPTVYWSDEVARIHEVPPGTAPRLEEAIDYYPPEWRARLRAVFDDCVHRGTPYDEEMEIVTARGNRRWVRTIGEPLRDDAGNIIGAHGSFQDITNQKQREHALRESEQRFRALFEGSRAVMLLVRPGDGAIVDANPAATEFYGWSKHQLTAMSVIDLNALDPEAARARIDEAKRSGGKHFQTVHRRADGRPCDVEVYSNPVKIAGEELLFSIVHDISERVTMARIAAESQSETARLLTESERTRRALLSLVEDLRLAESRLKSERELAQSTLDALQEHICVLDEAGTIIAVNRAWNAFAEANRLEPSAVGVGVNYLAACRQPGQRDARVANAVADRLEDLLAGRTESFEVEYTCDASHEARWFLGRALRFPGPGSARVLVAHENITARKRAEERLREHAELLDKAQDAILVRDLQQRIVFWNRSAERIYGWTTEEVKYAGVQDLLHRDPAAFDAAIRTTLEQGEWHGELEQTTRDGRHLVVECRLSLVRDDEGKPTGILSINTDITERKRLEQQFLRAQRMESIGTLASGIAHDLNNLLAPITMGVGLLKTAESIDEVREVVEPMEQSARRAADLIRQVLTFARGAEGARVPLRVEVAVRDLRMIVENTFPRNIRLAIDLPADLWPIRGDPTQVHQVLLNLCVNARDAMPTGGPLVIRARNVAIDHHYSAMDPTVKPGSFVQIDVVDAGVGMAPEIRERIFDPFFTTKQPGKGTGLGLATVLSIVRGHGGFVQVESEPGRGSTFSVFFPAAEAEVIASPTAGTGSALERGAGELVLVVDDEPSILAVTRRTLEGNGYRVLTAEDGANAIALFAQHGKEVAAVLTDMMMPVMDGPALIAALRHMDPHLPIIASSGLRDPATGEGGEALANIPFLSKPYSSELLCSTLRRVIAMAKR